MTHTSHYTGGCHCGRVRFAAEGDLAETLDCNCSICVKKGFLHLIVQHDHFQLLAGQGELATYSFGTGIAKHMFCRNCGMHPFYIPRSDPEKIDVNVRCLDGIDIATVAAKPFDGRDWEVALRERDTA
jgi:hypothetical protein